MVLIGHYHFGIVLGRGRFGWVSQATHKVVGHSVAVKHQPWAVGGGTCGGVTGKHAGCQHVEEQKWRAALENEAELLARISHPSIVALLEVVRMPEELYVCLEYLGEMTLASLVLQQFKDRDTGLAEPEAACIFRQVAAGLHHLHSEGIVHRDVKPENIMVILSQSSKMPIAKLIDLGLAAAWGPLSPLNTSCTRAGTVTYLAPELTSSSHAYGPEVDVFSLGASLYYALTGETPFLEYNRNGKRGTTALFGLQIQHEEAIDEMTTEVALLLKGMLKTNPSERWTLTHICSYPWILQDYHPSGCLPNPKTSLLVDCFDSYDIRSLFNMSNNDCSKIMSHSSSCSSSEKGSISSEDLTYVSIHWQLSANLSNSSSGSVSKIRIRTSSSNYTEDTKDLFIDMECVDRVSSLIQRDNEHVLQHLGEEPWGPVGGIYNLLLLSGVSQRSV